jgi:prophage DNA circulation protein
LDTLAYQFLGDQSLWYIIAQANNIHDPSFAVEDGTTLRIPANYTNYLNL